MTPRQVWFKDRIDELIKQLAEVQQIYDWQRYKQIDHEIASELMYVCTEWDKYYRDIDEKMAKYES